MAAPAGFNTDNETMTNFSKSIGLEFADTNNNEIPITNSRKPIKFLIPRDTTEIDLQNDVYLVNRTKIRYSPGKQFLPNGINITATNASINIELFPTQLNLGYIFLLSWNATPVLNTTHSYIDYWRIFCPKGI